MSEEAGRATLRSIAERAGVHPSTASRVLRSAPNRVSETTAERIRAIAAELAYEPDVQAQALRTRKTLAIGIVIPRLTDMVLSLMVEAASEQARKRGYQAITMSTRDRDEDQSMLVDLLIDRRVDGIILGTVSMEDPLPDDLLRRGVPFVLLNRRSGAHPSVCGDDELGGYLATAHLLEQGHRRIGLVAGPERVSTSVLRLAGYRRAHEEAGLRVDANLIINSLFGVEAGETAAGQLLDLPDPPSAIFAVNDFAAIGAMGAVGARGLRIPLDIAVVGYNGIPIASRLPVPLSTVALPLEEMGRRAIDALLEQLAGRPSASLVLPPVLQVGASSFQAPSAAGG